MPAGRGSCGSSGAARDGSSGPSASGRSPREHAGHGFDPMTRARDTIPAHGFKATGAVPYSRGVRGRVSLLAKGGRLREGAKRALAESARILGTITHVATREPLVALTFDDGPDPVFTRLLLELLEGHGARATFFMLGRN